ncbi:MAG TPA: VOC family protein [Baekduia sp.]|nr:VOC family protein [Baekduia sp.]
MSLPQPPAGLPFTITRISHVVLNVTDLVASRAFYEELIGLVVTAQEGDRVYLRGVEEAAHHSLVLQQANGEPTAERMGFRVGSEQQLDALKGHFEALGLPAEWADVPHQSRTLHATDPVGVPLEYCVTMPVAPRLCLDHHLYKGAAATRIDHAQVHVPSVAAWVAFHVGLGFRISEYASPDGTPHTPLLGAFLSRKGDLLDFVGVMNKGPRLHHVSFIVHDPSYTLTRAADIASGLGWRDAVEYGPARHGLAPQQFVYLRGPDGHRAELVSHGYQFLDPELEAVGWAREDPRAVATWGPMPGERWLEEAAAFRGVAVEEPQTSAG